MRTLSRHDQATALESRDVRPFLMQGIIEIIQHSLFGVIARGPGSTTRYEPNMASALVKFRSEEAVPTRDALDLPENVWWKKRVVIRAQEERGAADRRQETQRTRTAVVIRGTFEPVHRRRDDIVELEECTRSIERRGVEQIGIALELRPRLRSQRAKKVPGVDARESSLDESCAPLQIEWHRDGCSRPHFGGSPLALLSKPLEQDVAAAWEAYEYQRLARARRK